MSVASPSDSQGATRHNAQDRTTGMQGMCEQSFACLVAGDNTSAHAMVSMELSNGPWTASRRIVGWISPAQKLFDGSAYTSLGTLSPFGQQRPENSAWSFGDNKGQSFAVRGLFGPTEIKTGECHSIPSLAKVLYGEMSLFQVPITSPFGIHTGEL